MVPSASQFRCSIAITVVERIDNRSGHGGEVRNSENERYHNQAKQDRDHMHACELSLKRDVRASLTACTLIPSPGKGPDVSLLRTLFSLLQLHNRVQCQDVQTEPIGV